MKMTPEQYKTLYKDKSKKSPIVKDTIWAFVVGGIICVIGQFISNFAKESLTFSDKDAAAFTAIILILITALLTGLKVFDNIAKHAGAGTFVPISGFANSIVSPAMEFKSEGLVLGMAAKMFVVAGPVLVYGISASVVYGIILYLMGM